MADVNGIDPIDPNDPQSEPDHIKTYPWVYVVTLLLIFGIVAGTAIKFTELRYWIIVAGALLLAVSIRVRDRKNVHGIFVAGMPSHMAWVGVNIVIPFIMSMPGVVEYPPQFQFPEDPENVYHGDDKNDLPINANGVRMVRPLRLTTGGKRAGYANDELNYQLTTKATGTMRARIRNFFDFWVRVNGDTAQEKLVELKRQMNDTWFNSVKNEWVQRPIGLCIDESDEIERIVCQKVDKAARTRGIDSYEVTLLTPDLGHELAGKLSEIPESAAALKTTRNNADGAAYTTQKEGEAQAAVNLAIELADIEADATRVERMGITGREMFMADTAVRMLGDKDKFFFGAGGIGEAMGVFAAVADSLKAKEGKPPQGGNPAPTEAPAG